MISPNWISNDDQHELAVKDIRDQLTAGSTSFMLVMAARQLDNCQTCTSKYEWLVPLAYAQSTEAIKFATEEIIRIEKTQKEHETHTQEIARLKQRLCSSRSFEMIYMAKALCECYLCEHPTWLRMLAIADCREHIDYIAQNLGD